VAERQEFMVAGLAPPISELAIPGMKVEIEAVAALRRG
jgi:hypothetical protein